jgi:hypothetical protein
MPYISAEERPALDEVIEPVAEGIASELSRGPNTETSVSTLYRRTFSIVGRTLLDLASGASREETRGAEGRLALKIYGATGGTHDGAWLGRLNYSLTRLIQAVPRKMVEKGAWKEEVRYWVYAQTAGALARSAMEFNAMAGDEWYADGIVGVLGDVKDEYKRRVNAAYETFQIRKSGDCYTTRYRVDLSEVKDTSGRVVGFSEVMKDLGSPT